MKVILFGLGRMGQTHLRAVQHLGYKVTGVYDINPDQVDRIADEFNLGSDVIRGESFEHLIENAEADLAIIATTAPSHHDLVVNLAHAGIKKILCEKPLACSISEAESMILAAEQNGCLLAVNHQRRFMGQYQTVKQVIDSGKLGSLRSVTVSAANMGLSMNGIHFLEAFSWLTSSPISHVAAWLDPNLLSNPRGVEFVDYSGQIFALTNDEHRLYLDAGNDLGNGIIVTYGFTLGKIVSNEISGDMSIWSRNSEYSSNPTHEYSLPSSGAALHSDSHDLVLATAEVITALDKGTDYPTASDGLNALSTVIGAIRSNEMRGETLDISQLNDPQEHFNWA